VTRFELEQELLKGIDLTGHTFRVRTSHNESDGDSVDVGKKWGPSFTLCCSARDYIMRAESCESDDTDDRIENRIDQFIQDTINNLRKEDVIQVGPFGLEILQRVKQISSSWRHLRQGRVTSTKVPLIRTAMMSWMDANNQKIDDFYTIHTDMSTEELIWNSEMITKCRNDKDFLKSLHDVLFTDNSTSVRQSDDMKSGLRREQHCLDRLFEQNVEN
jgi:hypothetical protein